MINLVAQSCGRQQVPGGVGGNNRPLKVQLIERRAEALPTRLYHLQRRERAQQMVMFAGMLGTNALETLPFVVHCACLERRASKLGLLQRGRIIRWIGDCCGRARPVLILSSEEDYLVNVEATLARVGPASAGLV